MSTHRYPTGFLRPQHPVRGRMGSPLTGRVPKYILSLVDEDDFIAADIPHDVRHIVLEDWSGLRVLQSKQSRNRTRLRPT